MSLQAKAVKLYQRVKISLVVMLYYPELKDEHWSCTTMRSIFTWEYVLLFYCSWPQSVLVLINVGTCMAFYSSFSVTLPIYLSCTMWIAFLLETSVPKFLLLAFTTKPFQMNLSISAKVYVTTLSGLLHSHPCSDQGPLRLFFCRRNPVTSCTSWWAPIYSQYHGWHREKDSYFLSWMQWDISSASE